MCVLAIGRLLYFSAIELLSAPHLNFLFVKQTLQEDFGPFKSRYLNGSPRQYVALDKLVNIFSLFSHLGNEETR